MIKILRPLGLALFAAHVAASAPVPTTPTANQCAAIFKAAGDRYAGMWLASDGKLVLGLTSHVDLDQAIIKNIRVAHVKYSAIELEKVHNEVVKRKLDNTLSIFSTHIDYKTNRIIVISPREEIHNVIHLFKTKDADLHMFDFRIQNSTVTLMPLLDDGSCKR